MQNADFGLKGRLNPQSEIRIPQYFILSRSLVFALRQTKSEETLVSSWIDLIAFARSGAILSTLMLSNSHPPSWSGMVLVTTICSISDSANFSQARPDSTGCVKQAWM